MVIWKNSERPLPSGSVNKNLAAIIATALGIISCITLFKFTAWQLTALAANFLCCYLHHDTQKKHCSEYRIGGAAGAVGLISCSINNSILGRLGCCLWSFFFGHLLTLGVSYKIQR